MLFVIVVVVDAVAAATPVAIVVIAAGDVVCDVVVAPTAAAVVIAAVGWVDIAPKVDFIFIDTFNHVELKEKLVSKHFPMKRYLSVPMYLKITIPPKHTPKRAPKSFSFCFGVLFSM